MTLIINIYYELFTIADMSAKEVLSLLLHEIGHNFQHRSANASSLYYMQAINFFTIALMNLMSLNIGPLIQYIMFGTEQGRNHYGKMSSTQRAFISSKMDAFFNSIFMTLRSLTRFIPFLDIIRAITLLPIVGIITLTKSLAAKFSEIADLGYFGEKYSDNFVTSHGYAPEFISAMKKFELSAADPVTKFAKKSTFLQGYLDFMSLPLRFLNLIFDPHPATIFRVKDQIKMLESEFNKSDLSKEAKKALTEDLSRAKKEIEVFEDKAKSTKEFGKISTVFNAFLIKSYGGDPKEVIDKTKSYDYNEQ